METPATPQTSAPPSAIDTKLVRKLADILKDTGLTEIEVEQGELRIRVARELTVQAAPQMYAAAPAAAVAPALAAPSAAAPAAATPAGPAERKGDLVKSPMVGTIYLQATPGQPPFVKPGDKVTEGQTLMIVEAMKTMNPIPAPRAGVVAEILVEDSQPVEYGAPLVVLE